MSGPDTPRPERILPKEPWNIKFIDLESDEEKTAWLCAFAAASTMGVGANHSARMASICVAEFRIVRDADLEERYEYTPDGYRSDDDTRPHGGE